jgi:hypothetical protein
MYAQQKNPFICLEIVECVRSDYSYLIYDFWLPCKNLSSSLQVYYLKCSMEAVLKVQTRNNDRNRWLPNFIGDTIEI